MKKTVALFIAGFITLSFSLSLHAQSSEKELDQVALMKQFDGTWLREKSKDSIVVWEVLPSEYGEGYITNVYWKAKGKTYRAYQGIIGFSGNPKKFSGVSYYQLVTSGSLYRGDGKFVSETKLHLEDFNKMHTKVYSKWDLEFQSQDKFTSVYIVKGSGTWEDPEEFVVWEFNRVK